MKTRLILLLLGLPFMAISQFTSSLGLVVGSEFSYRHRHTSSNDPNIQFVSNAYGAETQKYNWRFGVNYNHKISPKLYLKTGIRFANVGYQRKITGLIYGNQFDGNIFDPTIESADPSEVRFTYDHLFIEIPLIARYQFNKKKWSPFVESGMSSMILFDQSNEYSFRNTTSQSDPNVDYKTLHFAGSLSVGMNYTPSDYFQFFVQPIFRYHFTTLVNDVPIKENLFNYGIEFGVRRRLQ